MLFTTIALLVPAYLPQSVAEPIHSRQTRSNTGTERHKLVFTTEGLPELDRVRSSGAVIQEHEYGGFTLVVAEDPILGQVSFDSTPGVSLRDDWNQIRFNRLTLDGASPDRLLAQLSPEETIGDPIREALPIEAGLYVLQFVGPVKDAWLDRIASWGATVVQYVPQNAFIVSVDPRDIEPLADAARSRPEIQYLGVYHPVFRLSPEIRSAVNRRTPRSMPVTIQLVNIPGVEQTERRIRRLANSTFDSISYGPYLNLNAVIDVDKLSALAADPRVFAIEQRGSPLVQDERQGQIVAGNTTGATPQAPGYLTWLAEQGFDATQFGSFVVNVADTAPSLSGHPDLDSSRIAFEFNPTNQPQSQSRAHGFFSAQILAGYNASTGSLFVDPLGYHYGLGVSPFARVGATAISGSGTFNPLQYEALAYNNGARISTNSWVYNRDGIYVQRYDSTAQIFDGLTRDANLELAGNQEYLFFFAAGNRGPGAGSVGSPAAAKNVIGVGSSENYRPTGTDGCGWPPSAADDVRDIISSSGRGPVNPTGGDGRYKPDLLAPGVHIQAGVPQSNYPGGLCNLYWPVGQTLYTWSTGTSHATPAAAGGGTLVYQWYLNHGLNAPSPAMNKAFLVGSGEYMTGVGGGDTLPSNSQGLGLMHLGRTLDRSSRIMSDQVTVFGSAGEFSQFSGDVIDASLPLRITLTWTDAPGPTTGAPWVNDLDLSVEVNGITYLGNQFAGDESVPGGAADFKNNVESVRLPAGTTGPFTITVMASAISADGVPGNADPTDQDFALLVHNGAGAAGPIPEFSTSRTHGKAPLQVQLTDQSTGTVTSWRWDFGDNSTSDQQSPSHVYSSPGVYDVSLTTYGPDGVHSETKFGFVTTVSNGSKTARKNL